jgi:vacuolar protein 8
MLESKDLSLITTSVACVRNLSVNPQNETPIIDAGFLDPLIALLSFEDNEEVQCHAASTLRNLATNSDKNRDQIIKAGAVVEIKKLVLDVPPSIQNEMVACVGVLALSGRTSLKRNVVWAHPNSRQHAISAY